MHFEIKEIVPDEVLVFRADYNTNSDADMAKGDEKDYSGGKITFGSQGKEGEALISLIIGNSHYARYLPEKNIDENCGTLMAWLKPFWRTANYIGVDQGRHLFSLYKNHNDSNSGENKRLVRDVQPPDESVFSINLAVFKNKGTTAQIRYTDSAGAEYVNMLSVDTNKDEGQRWYKDGPDKWTHLALTWDSVKGMIKLYINGELTGNKELDKWMPYLVGRESWMKVGDASKGTFTEFWGLIDRFKVYGKPLKDKHVKEIYNQEKD
ncbi:MAG: hypothetical protein PHF84_09790 [bacterium]|nr:hypothetical protein [bacterium]